MAVIPNTPNDHTRGPYEADEMRVPLFDRGVRSAWTRMEAEIFNAVTRYNDRPHRRMLFSQRIDIVSRMLAVFDTYEGEQ